MRPNHTILYRAKQKQTFLTASFEIQIRLEKIPGDKQRGKNVQ